MRRITLRPPFAGGGFILSGFKQFILRGNVIDMAVGVVIGAAFGGVVTEERSSESLSGTAKSVTGNCFQCSVKQTIWPPFKLEVGVCRRRDS
jgi:Large-conductance mechanosensitive channel, MscL